MTELDTTTARLSVLVGGNVSGVDLRIRDQGGATHFLQRFALRTRDAFDPVAAMKFALEHQNPLVAGEVTRGIGGTSGAEGSALPERSFSLLAISNPSVLLWALKPADDGFASGIVARLWNLSPEPQQFSLSLATGIDYARSVTHIETDVAVATVSAGALSASIAASQLSTYRLMPNGAQQ